MSSWMGASCATLGNVVLPNFSDTGPTVCPGFLSLHILSETVVTIAAVSMTAFSALPWSVTGIINADDEESWQMVMSPKLVSILLSSAGSKSGSQA